jgi:hypothetical protein
MENQTYSLSAIINTKDTRSFINEITVNGNPCKIYFEGGLKSIDISSSLVIVQKFTFVNNMNGSPDFVLSEILNYY